MAGIKLISIKLKEENSYFYENEGATFDKNDSEIIVTEEKIDKNASKKSKKASEKREKKQKQREKETKVSKKKKNSENENPIEITSDAANNNETPSANGDINRELGDGSDEANRHQEGSPSDETSIDSGLDTSTDNTQATEPMNTNLGSHVVEETVRSEGAEQSEEAPPETSHWRRKYEAETLQQEQHVEIEISEVTELEDSSEQASHTTESAIMVATVQEVESAEDLDSFFLEVYGEPAKKETDLKWSRTVRFQEPEPDEDDSDRETEASEGDVEDDAETRSTDESRTLLEPTQEIVDKEEKGNLESCEVNWDEVFEECETESPANSNESTQIVVEVHHGEIENKNAEEAEKCETGSPANSNESTQSAIEVHHGEIENKNAEEAEHARSENAAEKKKKKEKRKRSRLIACCFP